MAKKEEVRRGRSWTLYRKGKPEIKRSLFSLQNVENVGRVFRQLLQRNTYFLRSILHGDVHTRHCSLLSSNVRAPPSASPYTYDSRCCSQSPCSGLVFPPPPPPTISTTLPELRRNLNPLHKQSNTERHHLKSLIFPTPKRFTSRWMKNVLPPCAHFHSHVFLILPLFSGTQGRKKKKKVNQFNRMLG